MDKVKSLLVELLEREKIVKLAISNKKNKALNYDKVLIKPVLIKGEIKYQFEYIYKNKAIHENQSKELALRKIINMLQDDFKQMHIRAVDAQYQVLLSKKNKAKIIESETEKMERIIEHDKKKAYILKEGEPVDFLIYLGVMNENGKVFKSKYNKFKQINRFLELFGTAVVKEDYKEISIIDFGCGKSYLTFAMYYYLSEILNIKPRIHGLDLKEDVIDFCNKTSKALGYEGLEFTCQDIKDYTTEKPVDLVISLHACDTATDIAIEKAVRWGAKTILSVPCCQHELFNKINSKPLEALLKHGIIKERISALTTDALRASVLENLGYQVDIIEFIDLEHTPKNIMIRAIKNPNINAEKAKIELESLKSSFGLQETFLENILVDKLI